MFRAPLILAVAAALAGTSPAFAQDTDATPEADTTTAPCEDGGKPVVSQGLPTRPCAAQSGVKINRGPEVTPEPSEAAPEEPVQIRRVPAATTRTYGASSSNVRYIPATPYREPRSNYGILVQKDGVTVRIGDVWPYYPNPGDHRPRRGDHDPHHQKPQGIYFDGGPVKEPGGKPRR